MAHISAFSAYRYAPSAGKLEDLVTQPYDKITPEMQARYLAANPRNLVRVILGPKSDSDNDSDNVYTRAGRHFEEWTTDGTLMRDSEPSLYAYSQQFTVPDSGETLIRRGFIGLGAVEEYSAGIVHRHEHTLSGPKKDRRLVLEHTRAHFGQIFMLYSDPESRVDALLDRYSQSEPAAVIRDEYDTVHTLYRVSDAGAIAEIRELMADKKLLIADGHHRYETALAYRNDHPESEDAKWVMMTFVNMHAPGLRILATHRAVHGLEGFDGPQLLDKTAARFHAQKFDTPGAVQQIWEQPALNKIRIGLTFAGANGIYLLERDREPGELDVEVLHRELLEEALGISAEAVREGKHIKYVRGLEAAVDMVGDGEAQVVFLLEPTTIQQVADTAFNGGVMPQKSTDFYPKLLTGLTIYRLEK
jgi:uncharacterized protein (DUF1015 family)